MHFEALLVVVQGLDQPQHGERLGQVGRVLIDFEYCPGTAHEVAEEALYGPCDGADYRAPLEVPGEGRIRGGHVRAHVVVVVVGGPPPFHILQLKKHIDYGI